MFGALLENSDTFSTKYVFSYMILQFRLNSMDNFLTMLHDFEKQWLGSFAWKVIVCTQGVHKKRCIKNQDKIKKIKTNSITKSRLFCKKIEWTHKKSQGHCSLSCTAEQKNPFKLSSLHHVHVSYSVKIENRDQETKTNDYLKTNYFTN